MFGIIAAALKAISAAIAVFKQEKALHNSPDMVKNKLAEQTQAMKDAINQADAVLADPNATPDQHAAALRTIRLAAS